MSNGPAAAFPAIDRAVKFPNRHSSAKLLRLILLRTTRLRSVRAIAPASLRSGFFYVPRKEAGSDPLHFLPVVAADVVTAGAAVVGGGASEMSSWLGSDSDCAASTTTSPLALNLANAL